MKLLNSNPMIQVNGNTLREECWTCRLYYYPAASCFPDKIFPFCHSHENGNPVLNCLDSRFRGNDPSATLARSDCGQAIMRTFDCGPLGSVKKYSGKSMFQKGKMVSP